MKMSLKRYHYDRSDELCYTCKFIDEYALNVSGDGEVPHGWDGTAVCGSFDKTKKESIENNRLFISPCWKACPKYEKCTERQADYIDIYDSTTKNIIENPNDISQIKE